MDLEQFRPVAESLINGYQQIPEAGRMIIERVAEGALVLGAVFWLLGRQAKPQIEEARQNYEDYKNRQAGEKRVDANVARGRKLGRDFIRMVRFGKIR